MKVEGNRRGNCAFKAYIQRLGVRRTYVKSIKPC
jgi:hypothetical protein